MANREISIDEFETWLADGKELAVLDIRASEDVGYASPLFATNLPAERLAKEIGRFIPRQVVRTVLIDDGTGVAGRSAAELEAQGWANVVALEGGIPSWTAKHGNDGGPTFDTPGIDFALAVLREKGTPSITALELERIHREGADVIVIDTRTVQEFARDHVPGAVGVPAAELLLRFKDVVPSTETKVVVSCAGLPRAILGAQTLIDARVPNEVSFLYEGTKAWTAAGLKLENGKTQIYSAVSADARDFARTAVANVSADDKIQEINVDTARSWLRDPGRTTYLLDVRTPEEFAERHLEGSISSEGGQLLGVAYRTISVRGSRVVLIDDELGVRARTVAHWLQRRGYELAILLVDFDSEALQEVA
jgi:rhodanese-related sulfurtransferase